MANMVYRADRGGGVNRFRTPWPWEEGAVDESQPKPWDGSYYGMGVPRDTFCGLHDCQVLETVEVQAHGCTRIEIFCPQCRKMATLP